MHVVPFFFIAFVRGRQTLPFGLWLEFKSLQPQKQTSCQLVKLMRKEVTRHLSIFTQFQSQKYV